MSSQLTKTLRNRNSVQPNYRAPALEKGLSILEFLACDGRGHTQSEICKHIGRSQSEIFRMLMCLEERNYIRRGSRDDRYRLTPKLFELSHAHPPTRKLIDNALPVMRSFAEQTKQSCHLAVLQGYSAIVIAEAASPEFVGISVRPGKVLPLHEKVSGRVLATFNTDNFRANWLRDLEGSLSPECFLELKAKLKQIRKEGHDTCPSLVIEGIFDLSVPILNHQGRAVAAITAPCLLKIAEKNPVPEVLQQLHQSANEISQSIGAGEMFW